jgi:hypothetical protein
MNKYIIAATVAALAVAQLFRYEIYMTASSEQVVTYKLDRWTGGVYLLGSDKYIPVTRVRE